MMKLEKRVEAYIRQEHMIKEGDHILVGVSGGADSVTLLYVLHELAPSMRFEISAVHVNHGIREEASDDAEYVQRLCSELKVPFYLEHVDIPEMTRERSLTEEEAGRIARYEIFERLMGETRACRIAVAHNLNDQAETVLLNISRGSGLKGLTGIRPVRGNIIRPLLTTSRAEIEEYLEEKDIFFVTDRTNLEDDHTRNRIRHHVLPYLVREVNTAALDHIGSAAREALEAQNYIESRAHEVIERLDVHRGDGCVSMSLDLFRKEELIIRKYVLMELLGEVTVSRKDITGTHIAQILELCEGTAGSVSIDLPYGLKVERHYDRLEMRSSACVSGDREVPDVFGLVPDSDQTMELGDIRASVRFIDVPAGMAGDYLQKVPHGKYTKWFDYDKIQKLAEFGFRKRKIGDTIVIDRHNHSKSLKKFMIDEKIPENIRDDVWILADGSDVVWVVGYRTSGAYGIDDDTARILEISIE